MHRIGPEAHICSLLVRGTIREPSHQVAGMLEQMMGGIFVFKNGETHLVRFQKRG